MSQDVSPAIERPYLPLRHRGKHVPTKRNFTFPTTWKANQGASYEKYVTISETEDGRGKIIEPTGAAFLTEQVHESPIPVIISSTEQRPDDDYEEDTEPGGRGEGSEESESKRSPTTISGRLTFNKDGELFLTPSPKSRKRKRVKTFEDYEGSDIPELAAVPSPAKASRAPVPSPARISVPSPARTSTRASAKASPRSQTRASVPSPARAPAKASSRSQTRTPVPSPARAPTRSQTKAPAPSPARAPAKASPQTKAPVPSPARAPTRSQTTKASTRSPTTPSPSHTPVPSPARASTRSLSKAPVPSPTKAPTQLARQSPRLSQSVLGRKTAQSKTPAKTSVLQARTANTPEPPTKRLKPNNSTLKTPTRLSPRTLKNYNDVTYQSPTTSTDSLRKKLTKAIEKLNASQSASISDSPARKSKRLANNSSVIHEQSNKSQASDQEIAKTRQGVGNREKSKTGEEKEEGENLRKRSPRKSLARSKIAKSPRHSDLVEEEEEGEGQGRETPVLGARKTSEVKMTETQKERRKTRQSLGALKKGSTEEEEGNGTQIFDEHIEAGHFALPNRNISLTSRSMRVPLFESFNISQIDHRLQRHSTPIPRGKRGPVEEKGGSEKNRKGLEQGDGKRGNEEVDNEGKGKGGKERNEEAEAEGKGGKKRNTEVELEEEKRRNGEVESEEEERKRRNYKVAETEGVKRRDKRAESEERGKRRNKVAKSKVGGNRRSKVTESEEEGGKERNKETDFEEIEEGGKERTDEEEMEEDIVPEEVDERAEEKERDKMSSSDGMEPEVTPKNTPGHKSHIGRRSLFPTEKTEKRVSKVSGRKIQLTAKALAYREGLETYKDDVEAPSSSQTSADKGKGKGPRHKDPVVSTKGKGPRHKDPVVSAKGKGPRHKDPVVSAKGKAGRKPAKNRRNVSEVSEPSMAFQSSSLQEPRRKVSLPVPLFNMSERPPDVRIWQEHDSLRSLSDITDLDVILERLEERAWDIRESFMDNFSRAVVTKFMSKVQRDIRSAISESHRVTRLTNCINKLGTQIKTKRNLLLECQKRKAELNANIAELKKRQTSPMRCSKSMKNISDYLTKLAQFREKCEEELKDQPVSSEFVTYAAEEDDSPTKEARKNLQF